MNILYLLKKEYSRILVFLLVLLFWCLQFSHVYYIRTEDSNKEGSDSIVQKLGADYAFPAGSYTIVLNQNEKQTVKKINKNNQ